MKNRKHSGFTLVEILVAFAILGVAVLGIGGFFVSAARSYSSVSDETALQYEAQLALNQVENMLIDSTLGVSYNYVTSANESSEGYHFVAKDSLVPGGAAAVSKVLYAYNVNKSDSSKLDVLLMKWVAAKESIYYKVITVADGGSEVDDISIADSAGGWDLLAEDVVSFSADLSGYATNKKVEVDFGFENRSKDYHTSGTVLLRNNVLINENDIHKIYKHITKVSQSVIDGVDLTANPMVVVPGGLVQLRAKVTGTGYPNRNIHQWLVASDSSFTKILYDSTIDYGAEGEPARPDTYIDPTTQVLHVSDDIENDISDGDGNETIHVKAVVKTTDAQGAVVYFDDMVSIGVKLINNIVVTVEADTNQTYNSNLVGATFTEASLINQRANSANVPEMNLRPKNQVKMVAWVTASDSAAGDTDIIWSIINKSEGVIAGIDNSGTLKIDQYSRIGSFVVRASLKIDSTVYVDYKVVVGTQYDATTAKLEIVPAKNSINRGGNTACTLTLNNEAVDNKDYDWSLSVISSNGHEISGTPVTVNGEGGIYANYDLSYDYSYDVWITAALKVNPEIRAMAKISVPKVSLSISPMTKYSVMGGTVTGVTCSASGLEVYDINWSMSKDLNPKYFFTAWGNFNITGSKNANGTGNATVVLGDEEDPQTNVTVKAYLKNNTNYSATMRIFTGDARMEIYGGTTVKRGENLDLNVRLTGTATNITVSKETAAWEITDIKVDGNSMPGLIDNTISINKGQLIVGENFAESYDKKSLVITIRAYDDNYGLEDTHTVTVQRKKIELFPDWILIPNLSEKMTIQYTHYDGATWSVQKEESGGGGMYPDWGGIYPGSGSSSKITIDNDGTLEADDLGDGTSNNANYEVTMRMSGEDTTYTGHLRYGFEDDPNYATTKSLPDQRVYYDGRYRTQVSQFKMGQSAYYVYINGGKYPVYYVNYVEYIKRTSRDEIITSIKYAFVSNKESVDGNGQWYMYEEGKWNYGSYSESKWKKIDSPPQNWNNDNFIK